MVRLFFKKLILLSFICVCFASKAFADAGNAPDTALESLENQIKSSAIDVNAPVNNGCPEINQKIFSLGRGVGASYYHLIDLSDKLRDKPYKELKQEYNNAFQTLNIIDIILDDLNIQGKSRQNLNKARINFYSALQDQDLSETKISFVRDLFVVFYENLIQDINSAYSDNGSWFLTLGFYASFQLESINSDREEKILLSGFKKIISRRTFSVPDSINENLIAVDMLDKLYITQSDLVLLKKNLASITEYFTNYPESKPLFNEINDLLGVWQGILINPDNEKHDIMLRVKDDLTASMDIDGIAHHVMISDIKIVNNYFTFMFKPFGTEKLFLRFNAQLSENIFSGEITDVLGEKGYWVLAKTDEELKLSDEKLTTMVSYINQIEQKMKNQE
ncbi:MAG TPA: hypothetical protein P5556_06670 [Candidatus Gastranaerophilales bacterium]|nr:hypothetical protein [Candidatus Gastranaerophilales bacterium]